MPQRYLAKKGRFMRYLSSAFVGLCALGLVGCQPPATATAAPQHTLSVSGSASVEAVPDRVQLSLNVERMGMDIPALKSEVDGITRTLLQQLSELGVEETKIQSHAIRVYPQHRYSDGEQKLIGYQVNRRMIIDFDDANQHSGFLEFALNNGVQRVDEPVYQLSNADALYQQALTQAIAAARSKAEQMAAAAGVEISGVHSLQENSQQAPMVRYRVAEASMADSVSLPGQQRVEATVSMVFTLTGQN